MPTFSDIAKFVFVSLVFVLQVLCLVYFRASNDIQENWPAYRCNPMYWPFSKDISQDFNDCVVQTQSNSLGYMMEPVNYMMSSLGEAGTNLSNSVNDIREMFAKVRDFIGNIIDNIFGVFINIIIQFQKILISIKDMAGKMVGIVMTMMYVLDGSLKTMESTWKGPNGQLVRALGGGSCFHSQTPVLLHNGESIPMCYIQPGTKLANGSTVHAVMKLANLDNEPFYIMPDKTKVTGHHKIWNQEKREWCNVCDHPDAKKTRQIAKQLTSLITVPNHNFTIGNYVYWDWEDDGVLCV